MKIRNSFKRIKWWFQRANGKVTPDEWWDFKYSLTDYIKQGLEGLLYEGSTDWDAPYHKEEKEDLEFILDWAKKFPEMASCIIAGDDNDYENLERDFKGYVKIKNGKNGKERKKRHSDY